MKSKREIKKLIKKSSYEQLISMLDNCYIDEHSFMIKLINKRLNKIEKKDLKKLGEYLR